MFSSRNITSSFFVVGELFSDKHNILSLVTQKVYKETSETRLGLQTIGKVRRTV